MIPELWSLEVANVLFMARRRGRIDEGEINDAINNLRALPIDVDHKTRDYAFSEILEYASAYELTVSRHLYGTGQMQDVASGYFG